MSESVAAKAGLSEAKYNKLAKTLSFRAWVTVPELVREILVYVGVVQVWSSSETNAIRPDVNRQYGLVEDAKSGIEVEVEFENESLLEEELNIQFILKDDKELKILRYVDTLDVRNYAANGAGGSDQSLILTRFSYDTQGKFLRIEGEVYPEKPSRGFVLLLANGRRVQIDNAFLPSENVSLKTGGVVNRYGGFSLFVNFVGEGALSQMSLLSEGIDGSEQIWQLSADNIVINEPMVEVQRVHVNAVKGQFEIEGWYRSHDPISHLELKLNDHAVHGLVDVVRDDGLGKSQGLRGLPVYKFRIAESIDSAFDVPSWELTRSKNLDIDVSLFSKKRRVFWGAMSPKDVQLEVSKCTSLTFDKRRSFVIGKFVTAVGHAPSRAYIEINGKKIGRTFDVITPQTSDAEPACSWFVMEEINFELKSSDKVSVFAQAGNDDFIEISSDFQPMIVSADELIESPKQEDVVKNLVEEVGYYSSVDEPLAVFVYQGEIYKKGGASTRIIQMMSALKSNGYMVALIDRTAPWDYLGNASFFDGFYKTIDIHLTVPKKLKSPMLFNLRDRLVERSSGGQGVDGRLRDKVTKSAKEGRLIQNDGSELYKRVDSHFNFSCAALLHELKPDLVVTQFAWSCEIHDVLPAGAYGLLDTHDVQHSRYDVFASAYEKFGKSAVPSLDKFKVSKDTERGYLARADACIAITEHEADQLKDMVGARNVVTAGVAINQQTVLPKVNRKDMSLLFVGNRYEPNVYGVRHFLEKDWPTLRKEYGDSIKFNVVGSVCDEFAGIELDGVTFCGVVEDLAEMYRSAALIVNPTPFGTGLAIKMVEALGYGQAIVSTIEGARGLERAVDEGAVITADYDAYAEACISVLSSSRNINAQRTRARNYVNSYMSTEVVYSNLFNFLETKLFYSKI
ncbi:glycosyltransferase [Maricaulis sp. D1M11]|uniref:glycosyltransferase n=1 Tax=Maricaulis sp. D1M11 TaxID=3076117 RepID=UPI0039B45710